MRSTSSVGSWLSTCSGECCSTTQSEAKIGLPSWPKRDNIETRTIRDDTRGAHSIWQDLEETLPSGPPAHRYFPIHDEEGPEALEVPTALSIWDDLSIAESLPSDSTSIFGGVIEADPGSLADLRAVCGCQPRDFASREMRPRQMQPSEPRQPRRRHSTLQERQQQQEEQPQQCLWQQERQSDYRGCQRDHPSLLGRIDSPVDKKGAAAPSQTASPVCDLLLNDDVSWNSLLNPGSAFEEQRGSPSTREVFSVPRSSMEGTPSQSRRSSRRDDALILPLGRRQAVDAWKHLGFGFSV